MIKFGTDGWRAILEEDFTESNVKRVTLAIGKYVYETFGFEKTIIIGDSLSSDIKGGCRVGIKTCWFNPKKLENNTEYNADYEITSLYEIKNIL